MTEVLLGGFITSVTVLASNYFIKFSFLTFFSEILLFPLCVRIGVSTVKETLLIFGLLSLTPVSLNGGL